MGSSLSILFFFFIVGSSYSLFFLFRQIFQSLVLYFIFNRTNCSSLERESKNSNWISWNLNVPFHFISQGPLESYASKTVTTETHWIIINRGQTNESPISLEKFCFLLLFFGLLSSSLFNFLFLNCISTERFYFFYLFFFGWWGSYLYSYLYILYRVVVDVQKIRDSWIRVICQVFESFLNFYL